MRLDTWNDLLVDRWSGSPHPAIVDDDGSLSGDELLELAGGASSWFTELGIERTQAVPVLMDESRTSIAMVVGGALSGRPLAPLGTRLTVDELTTAVRDLGSAWLFADPARAALAEQVAWASGAGLVVADRLEPAPPVEHRTEPHDVAVIVHTSGTTGSPKPVELAQQPLAERVRVYQEVMDIGPGDRYCSASPFHHTAGVAMDVTVLGMGVAIVPQDWFSLENWRRAGRLGVTCALLVPTMIEMLLEAEALGEVNPRVLQYGAMPIHPDTLRAAMAVLPDTRMLQIFGQTEASPLTFLSHDDHVRAATDRHDLLTSVGRAVPRTELAVEHPDAEGIGELIARAAHLFQADDDRWRRTGDLGRISGEGYVSLHGRVNDMIIRGGENIYPIEIERVLMEHPGVAEVAVVGFPDRRLGEVVKAAVVAASPNDPPDPDELCSLVGARLARFKVPAIIEFVPELPRNSAGKVLRRSLR